MSRSPKLIAAEAREIEKEIKGLTNELAKTEALLGQKREKLLRLKRQLGEAPPTEKTGLEMLWDLAPLRARQRSSKYLCRQAWAKIPKAERPSIADLIAALKAWKDCDEWRKDGGEFIPALDRWLKERRYECAPETRNPLARYEAPKRQQQAPATTGEELDGKAAADFLASLDFRDV